MNNQVCECCSSEKNVLETMFNTKVISFFLGYLCSPCRRDWVLECEDEVFALQEEYTELFRSLKPPTTVAEMMETPQIQVSAKQPVELFNKFLASKVN